MIGGLGGFVLPIVFGIMNDLIGVWTSSFMLMFGIVLVSLVWMHIAIRIMERRKYPELAEEKHLSDVPEKPVHAERPTSAREVHDAKLGQRPSAAR